MKRPRRPHVGGAFSRPVLVATAPAPVAPPVRERIRPSSARPSQRRLQNRPERPPRPTTRYPTDTLEPCTES